MPSTLENSQSEVFRFAEKLKDRSVCSQDQEKADLLRRATQAHREYTDMVSVQSGGFAQQMRVLVKDETLRAFSAATVMWPPVLLHRAGSDLTVL